MRDEPLNVKIAQSHNNNIAANDKGTPRVAAQGSIDLSATVNENGSPRFLYTLSPRRQHYERPAWTEPLKSEEHFVDELMSFRSEHSYTSAV